MIVTRMVITVHNPLVKREIPNPQDTIMEKGGVKVGRHTPTKSRVIDRKSLILIRASRSESKDCNLNRLVLALNERGGVLLADLGPTVVSSVHVEAGRWRTRALAAASMLEEAERKVVDAEAIAFGRLDEVEQEAAEKAAGEIERCRERTVRAENETRALVTEVEGLRVKLEAAEAGLKGVVREIEKCAGGAGDVAGGMGYEVEEERRRMEELERRVREFEGEVEQVRAMLTAAEEKVKDARSEVEVVRGERDLAVKHVDAMRMDREEEERRAGKEKEKEREEAEARREGEERERRKAWEEERRLLEDECKRVEEELAKAQVLISIRKWNVAFIYWRFDVFFFPGEGRRREEGKGDCCGGARERGWPLPTAPKNGMHVLNRVLLFPRLGDHRWDESRRMNECTCFRKSSKSTAAQ